MHRMRDAPHGIAWKRWIAVPAIIYSRCWRCVCAHSAAVSVALSLPHAGEAVKSIFSHVRPPKPTHSNARGGTLKDTHKDSAHQSNLDGRRFRKETTPPGVESCGREGARATSEKGRPSSPHPLLITKKGLAPSTQKSSKITLASGTSRNAHRKITRPAHLYQQAKGA